MKTADKDSQKEQKIKQKKNSESHPHQQKPTQNSFFPLCFILLLYSPTLINENNL